MAFSGAPSGSQTRPNPVGRRQRSASWQMAEVNLDPIVQGALMGDEPLTETLNPDSDLSGFVEQRRRAQKPPRMRSRSSSSSNVDIRFRKEHQIIVGNVPSSLTALHWIRETFSRYGRVIEVTMCRNPNAQPYAHVTFDSEAAVSRATARSEVTSLQDVNHVFHVRPRKLPPAQGVSQVGTGQPRHEPVVYDPARTTSSQTYASVILSRCKKRRVFGEVNEWRSAVENFDWKPCAARYLFRTITMEDYLIEYIVTQASYRGIRRETLRELAQRLDLYSVACPLDRIEMMPPSVSGVVCNHIRECGTNYENKLEELLQRCDRIQILEGNPTVEYLEKMSPEIAKEKMKEILVEGVFVYFFAKFCHGPKFKIRFPFYQRSEPVRSTIIAVTGISDVNEAIRAYFRTFDDIFVFDPETDDLSMVKDYFDKTCKEDMRLYLNKTAHKHPITDALCQQKSNVPTLAGFPKYTLFGLPQDSLTGLARTDGTLPIRPKPISPPKKLAPEPNVAFEADEPHGVSDLFNLSGSVVRILDDARGEVRFMLNDQPAVASFKRKDTYVDAKRMTADLKLKDLLAIGDRVHFTVSNSRHGRFTCNYVWKGKMPSFVERMMSSGAGCPRKLHFAKVNADQERLNKHINDILEPAEVTGSIRLSEIPMLPPSVESVVRDVLREDHGRNILSNPLAIDGVLNQSQNSFKLAEEKSLAEQARERIKIKIEREMRLLLSKLMAEYNY